MDIRWWLGIDGGGSGTRARLWAADGRIVGAAEAGPSGLSQGLDQALQALAAAAQGACAAAGEAGPDWARTAVGLGLAGAHVQGPRADLLARWPRCAVLALDTDGHAALLGAHGGRPGLVLAAGTGSVAEAWFPDGRRAVTGGWGFPSGDEGSGAWLGLRSVAIAQQALDGRAGRSPWTDAVLGATGDQPQLLQDWCAAAGQNAYAALAPLVFEHEAADPRAAALLARAVRALEAHVAALDPAGWLPLALAGSIANRLAPRLAPALLARRVQPAGDAMDGARHLARQRIGAAA
jgi:glucosamine kinase